MSTKKVIIEVEEIDSRISLSETHYLLRSNALIPKSACTPVQEPVEEVKTERKLWCIKRIPENAFDLNEWANRLKKQNYHKDNCGYMLSEHFSYNDGHRSTEMSLDYLINNGYVEVPTVEEFFEKVGYKPVPPRKLLGTYEGKEVYEDTKAWFVNLDLLKIEMLKDIKSIENFSIDGALGTSKVYLTPEEANARLKEEIEKKAMDYKVSISQRELSQKNKSIWAIAVEQVEKEFGVTYLNQ